MQAPDIATLSEAVERLAEVIEDFKEFQYLTPPKVQTASDLKPLTKADVAHITDASVRAALLGDNALLNHAVRAAQSSWFDDNNEGNKPALDLEPKAYQKREDAMLALDVADTPDAVFAALRRYWL
jgi:hypothetical protein